MDLINALTSTPIDLAEARKILARRKSITGKLDVFDNLASIILKGEPDCVTFLSNKANGYLFDCKTLVKFLTDSGADNLLVLLAAHDKNDGSFKLGDPTVMLVPCQNIMEDINTQEVSVTAIKGANAKVALEHPPVRNVIQINE